ncbi:acyl-CoA synthetase [Halobacteriales archaeon Cl-PHB]
MTDVPRLDAYHFHEREWEDYQELRDAFEWELPERFNIADYVCDRWASDTPDATAITAETGAGQLSLTFRELAETTDRLANFLADRGVGRGDRVAVNTGQRPETLFGHLAAWKLGAVSIPLSTLYGTEGLRYRLDDAQAQVAVVDEYSVDTLREVADDVPSLETALLAGDAEPTGASAEITVTDALAGQSPGHDNATMTPDDDAAIFYTSGTTGPPKGVRHGHRLVLGNLPFHLTTVRNMSVADDDVMWTPTEWSWIGTIPGYVLSTLYYGTPVVADDRERFDPERAFEVIERYDVTIGIFPPTALRKMRAADPSGYDTSSMRVVSSGGESLGEEIRDWVAEAFDGALVQETFGQTEADGIIGECEALYPPRDGTMGRALPGHDVRILAQDSTADLAPGETGEICLAYEGNAVAFKEYLDRPEATAEKVTDGWLRTEDLGVVDEDGYFRFVSRKDDVIITSGYRIGPGEIEECLRGHEAVVDCGVTAVPDDERGEVPKAFVVLADSYDLTDALRSSLKAYVRGELAKYQYPREIEAVESLPKTSTGKIRRTELQDASSD